MWSVTPDTDTGEGGAEVKMRETFREDYLCSGREINVRGIAGLHFLSRCPSPKVPPSLPARQSRDTLASL